ncbi:hypothetical protein [Chitinibacter tainanensis]|uniref:hypothetical protein n=1 Tax=Chitinibacter tainanensis TaxID=230667 RepID=UPI000412319E|nr:hypothetical protein [Chitinibacter tainanensis]
MKLTSAYVRNRFFSDMSVKKYADLHPHDQPLPPDDLSGAAVGELLPSSGGWNGIERRAGERRQIERRQQRGATPLDTRTEERRRQGRRLTDRPQWAFIPCKI